MRCFFYSYNLRTWSEVREARADPELDSMAVICILTWYREEVTEAGQQQSDLIQHMIVEARCWGESWHGLGNLGILALTEPDWWGVGVCLGQGGVDDMFPASCANKTTGELIHTRWHNLQSRGKKGLWGWDSWLTMHYYYRSWVFGKQDSMALISCFKTLRQAILPAGFYVTDDSETWS